jgi:hypothetical protein
MNKKYINLIIILLLFVILFMSFKNFFGINIFNENLLIDNYITYLIVLLFGIFSINEKEKIDFPIYSFSILLLTSIGSILGFNYIVQGITFSLGFIILILFILNEYEFIKLKFKNINFNFILLCVYSLTVGSILHSLFIILLFFIGKALSKYLKVNKLFIFIKLILILFLAFIILNRVIWTLKYEDCIDYKNNIHSIITSEYQYAEVNLKDLNENDIILQKDIPVKIILDIKKLDLIHYGNKIVIKDYNIDIKLKEGINVIEFAPNEIKTINFNTWMNMQKRKIKVIDAINCFINEGAVCNSKC